MEDVSRDLVRLGRYATALEQLTAELDRAAPERSEGTDHSGTVTAVLGPDGLPETIQVHARWRERLSAGSFTAAVGDACADALRERGAAWARAVDPADWQRRLARLELDHARAVPEPSPLPEAFQRPGRGGADGTGGRGGAGGGRQPWALGTLTEDAIGAYDGATAAVAQPPVDPHGTGSNPEHTVALTLRPGGRVTCQADPRWVQRQTGTELTGALGSALAAARQSLARALGSEEAARRSAQARQLLDEILAALGDMARPSRET